MDESTAVHGFADRLPHRRALQRLYVWVALKTACPILLGLYIDTTGGPLALAPVVALAPLEGLTFQILIWRRYLRVFGMPPLPACRRMLQLDAMRTYNPRGIGTSPSRGSALHLAAGFAGVAAVFYAASWYAASVTPRSILRRPLW